MAAGCLPGDILHAVLMVGGIVALAIVSIVALRCLNR